MSNEWNKDKTAGDYIEQRYWGENGVATGTASNNIGVETRSRRDDAAKKESGSGSSSNNKVICTELVRQGLMSRADLVLGARYFSETLSERHMRGYHAWAVRAVQGMRQSSLQTAFWRVLAQSRADAIAARYGDTRRGHIVKSAVLHGFNALCWTVGGFASEQDWQRLYHTDLAA
ncbi:hypothetical protein [Neorhizobium galegae]|uniref:hypothetical protein n=1 Tax=Neorhizobium galegae TaxID=399 RepID=UPI0021038CDD|nr:hypothetical protein [Neorhizobium galegae]MCQ1835166.1 hypothetical protein [Neorhizobium galegae]UIY29116.1 hypothetical protein LZK73_21405 [Neorhizobium galegae]